MVEWSRVSSRCIVVLLVLSSLAGRGWADDDKGVAVAPPDTEAWKSSFEGTWFVSRVLKKRLETLLARVASLEGQVRAGNLSTDAARRELEKLREDVKKVSALIEREKVLVAPLQLHAQEEEGTIEVGEEQLIVVTADKVRVIGWDKPHVKYVLRRLVFSAGAAVDNDMKDIVLEHEYGVASQLVGKTDAERAADEAEYQASEAGQKLNEEQQAARRRFLAQIAGDYVMFKEFQGKRVNTLRVAGLTSDEGNRQIRYEVRSPGGGGQVGSRWRRHAELTLYVPHCSGIAIRGCQVGLDIRGVNGHLVLTNAGSRDRDYSGTFEVREHRGPLTAHNVPLDLISDVQGDIQLIGSTELVNSGTNHQDGFRTAYSMPPRQLTIEGVKGTVNAHFLRSKLRISGVEGRVNVRNDFGDTELVIANDDQSHRVVSLSGRVDVTFAESMRSELPVFLATLCGSVRTTLSRQDLDELNFTQTSQRDGLRHNWRAMYTPVGDDWSKRFQLFSRPDEIITDQERATGWDFISQSGTVQLQRTN